MPIRLRVLMLVFLGCTPLVHAQPAAQALRFGRLVDGLGHTHVDAVVVVKNGRVISVGTGDAAVPAGVAVTDLRPLTAIPGLIDAHTHMTYVWDRTPGTTPFSQPAREPADVAKAAAVNARATLATGVTTARDLGARGGSDYLLRAAIDAGTTVGPRLLVSGAGLSVPREGPAPTNTELVRAVEMRLKEGADWIKVYGSRGSYQSVDTTQTFGFEAMKAIVDRAHAHGLPVAIHSYGPSGARDAVRAGADSIEHGIDFDDETLAEMARRGTVWVPTIDHNRFYVDAREDFQFAPETIPPLRAYIERNLETTRRAVKAGVRIAMGSDAVYGMFGQNTRELGWLVKAGMTPAQALASATAIPAAMLGRSRDMGIVAPGALADIVAVDGDPLADIDVVISRVRWVMKGGVVVEKGIGTNFRN